MNENVNITPKTRASFRVDYNQSNYSFAQKAAIFFLFLWVLFGVLDLYFEPFEASELMQLRFNFFLILLCFIISTYVVALRKHWQWLMSGFVIAAGVGSLLMVSYLNGVDRYIYTQWLLVIIFYGYVVSRMQIVPAACAGLTVSLLYFYMEMNAGLIPEHYMYTQLMLQVVANIFGIFILNYNGGLQLNEYQLKMMSVQKARSLTNLNQILEGLATTDGLTGLANRRQFDECLQEMLSIPQARIALLLMDVDHFKNYNDHYGHLEGDECLKTIARCIEFNMPAGNHLASRYGGEEFAILLRDYQMQDAHKVAQKLWQAVNDEAIKHENSPIGHHVSVSIGIGVVDAGQANGKTNLIQEADSRLYEAKENGRNQIRFAANS